MVITLIWLGSGFFKTDTQDQKPSAMETVKKKNDLSVLKSVRVIRSKAIEYASDITVNGKTKSSRTVEIKAETDGKIVEISAKRGARVKQGQVIARIEVNARKANMLKAQELVKQREIEYKAAKNLTHKGFNSKIRLAATKTDLESARADFKAAEVELENTIIKAPFEGVLEERNVELGTYLKSDSSVGLLVDLNPIDVVGFISERYIAQIAIGNEASAILPDGRDVTGKVSYVAATADNATRTFQVEIELGNDDYTIVEGLTAKLRLPGKTQKAHKISPAYLSLDDQGIVGVKAVDDQKKVVFYRVNVISDTANNMWVDGLPDQVDIITIGQNFVSVGQSVEAVLGEKVAPLTLSGQKAPIIIDTNDLGLELIVDEAGQSENNN